MAELSYEDVCKLGVDDLRKRYGQGRPGGLEIDGINHVAFVCSDMAKTIWFWSEGLGLKLTKTIALPDGGQHFFMDGGRGAALAYFWFPNAPKKVPGVSTINVEDASLGSFATAHGSVNHVAWNVDAKNLREYRRRIKKMDVGFVSPILYHTDEYESGYGPEKNENTTWESFYFIGPDSEYVELTSQTKRPFTPDVDIQHKPKTNADAEPASRL